jgi:hypothetical protein
MDLRRADTADPFRLVDLAQRGPGRADREEQVRIDVAAGDIVAPVREHGHHGGSPRLVSPDDTQGEPRRAAALHQPAI